MTSEADRWRQIASMPQEYAMTIRAYHLCLAAEPHTEIKPCETHRTEAVRQLDVARARQDV